MSEKYQFFNGLKFTRDDKTGYYLNSTNRLRIHRAVWEYFNGPIPDGFHVHHKDGDKSNNSIENLELMKAGEHLHYHGTHLTNEQLKARRQNMDKKARPAASAWHGSKSGKEWHKVHYEQFKDVLHKKYPYTCSQCGSSFEAEAGAKFCSNKCKSAWRRHSGIDDVDRECKYCGGIFHVNKYSKSETCSRSCANRLKAQRRRNQQANVDYVCGV